MRATPVIAAAGRRPVAPARIQEAHGHDRPVYMDDPRARLAVPDEDFMALVPFVEQQRPSARLGRRCVEHVTPAIHIDDQPAAVTRRPEPA